MNISNGWVWEDLHFHFNHEPSVVMQISEPKQALASRGGIWWWAYLHHDRFYSHHSAIIKTALPVWTENIKTSHKGIFRSLHLKCWFLKKERRELYHQPVVHADFPQTASDGVDVLLIDPGFKQFDSKGCRNTCNQTDTSSSCYIFIWSCNKYIHRGTVETTLIGC